MHAALYSLENVWLFWISQVTPHSDLIIPRNWQKWFYIWNRYPSGREVIPTLCNHISPQVQAWLAKVPVSRGAQEPNTKPLSAGYRIFIQPSQWRLQEPSKMFTQEKPRWEVRTCKSNPLVCTVLIFPGRESPGGAPFDLIMNLHYTIWSCVHQNEMARVAGPPFLDASKNRGRGSRGSRGQRRWVFRGKKYSRGFWFSLFKVCLYLIISL